MLSLLPTEDETMLADTARGFLDDAAPVTRLRAMRDTGQRQDPDLWRRMADLGWAGVLVPGEAGGADMGHSAANLLAHEMGKTLAVSPFISTAVIAASVLRAGTRRGSPHLAQIAAGALTYALAIDEGAKHAPDRIALQAQPAGNGFRLSGAKTFVIDGGLADRLLVLARTGDGLTLFDIAADAPGLTRTPMDLIDSRDAARLAFADVEATGDDVVGEVGQSAAVLTPALNAGNAALAAELTGLAAGAFAMTTAYLKDRQQFGRPIGSFQALQHRAAHLWCEMEVTASTTLNTGRMLDQDPDHAALAVSLAKVRAIRTARLAVSEGVQMHGGIGMTDALDMGFYVKRARVAAEWLGDESYHTERVARLRGL